MDAAVASNAGIAQGHTDLVLAFPLLIQFPAITPGKITNGDPMVIQLPASHVGALSGVPDSRRGPCPFLAVVAIRGVNPQMGDLSLSL